MNKSKLYIALARADKVRILISDTTNVVESARLTHDLYPTSNAALGRVLSVSALMGAMQKGEDDRLLVNINGHGPIGTIMVEAKSNGDIKGFVGDNTIYLKYNDSGKLAVGVATGRDGYLKVTRYTNDADFTSQVALQTGEIGEDFAYYFAVSEQVPSVVSVGVLVNTDYTTKAAGSMIIQLLPNHTEEDIVYVENLTKTLKPISSVIESGVDVIDYLKTLFDDVKVVGTKEITYTCDCHKERFLEALMTLPKDDLKEILQDERIEVKCEYCNKKYEITHGELLDFINAHR